MQGVLQQAVSLVAAPLSQAARLLAALEEAAEENPSLIAGAGSTGREHRPRSRPTTEDSSRPPQLRPAEQLRAEYAEPASG